MNRYKVCVYAICKNEESFVERWYESMKEADEIFVLDTGSTDATVENLKKYGVNVKIKKINPWRFDIARNESLKMIPDNYDICVCTDLDEVFNKGWRKELEQVWKKDTTRCRYIYNWKLKDNKPIISFYYEKIHSKKGFEWIYPVHEILKNTNSNDNYVTIDNIILNHYPDNTKSRSSYLPLLELSVKENPNNDRNTHYLGREYMYYQKWNESIDTLIKHLSLPNAIWKDERCASMRFISRCYIGLNRIEEAKMWLNKAIEEAPYLRDPYVEKALLYYELKDWKTVEDTLLKASKIKINKKTYINEPFSYDETIDDLLSLSYYYQNKYEKALKHINNALIINPENERIKNNKELILNRIKEMPN